MKKSFLRWHVVGMGAPRAVSLFALLAGVAHLAVPVALAQNSLGQAPGSPSNEVRNSEKPQGAGSPPATQGAGGQAGQGGFGGPSGQGAQGGQSAELMRLEAHERKDHGVAPTPYLHRGPMHGGTPTSIPGAQLVTTRGLVELMRTAGTGSGQAAPAAGGPPRVLFFDVLGGAERLPGALTAVPAHQAGSFDDAVQRDFGGFLQQVTQGRQDTVLVFYCASTQCWMSYNAALRAARLGYRQVLWYRGGLEAWKAAGFPLQGAGGAYGQGGAPTAPPR